jgi:hypothetical protein
MLSLKDVKTLTYCMKDCEQVLTSCVIHRRCRSAAVAAAAPGALPRQKSILKRRMHHNQRPRGRDGVAATATADAAATAES